MRIFSEVELNLPPKWFTGAEWADGTAQHFHRQEYKEATLKAERFRKGAHAHRDDKKAQRRDFERLAFEDNKGLSPIEICRRAMRRP
jgi:hypothetical protein